MERNGATCREDTPPIMKGSTSMTTATWNGGSGLYATPENWDTGAVPGAGDTAAINSGEALAASEDIPATVVLGGTDPGAAPALDLLSASVGNLVMPHDLPQPPYLSGTSPAQYGTLNVSGDSRAGLIDLGAFANASRFGPPPYSHPPLFAADNLTVNLGGGSTLAAGFDVREGSTLTVNGDDTSFFEAADSLVEGGKVVIDAPLGGEGRIAMTEGTATYWGAADVGTLELGGAVGAGTTVDIRMGHLVIDQPMRFEGQIDIRADEHAPDLPGSRYDFGVQDAVLKNLAATSYSFDDASHALTLFNGDEAVDQLRFTPDITAGSFGTSYPAIRIVQTGGDVSLQGYLAGSPTDPNALPVHA